MCDIALCFLDNPALIPLSCAMSVVLYIFIYNNRSKGHSVFLNGRKALVVESLLTGSLREPDLLGTPEDSHMNRLYKSLIVYMKRHKPYLDPCLTLETLSKLMMTNRVYLSRTINAFSGVNYSTFINNYRIEYAKELMLSDPSLRSEEVGRAAGFQADSTFSRVFKQITGETPSSYIKNIRSQASLHHRPKKLTARRGPDYHPGFPADLWGLEGLELPEGLPGLRPEPDTSSRKTY